MKKYVLCALVASALCFDCSVAMKSEMTSDAKKYNSCLTDTVSEKFSTEERILSEEKWKLADSETDKSEKFRLSEEDVLLRTIRLAQLGEKGLDEDHFAKPDERGGKSLEMPKSCAKEFSLFGTPGWCSLIYYSTKADGNCYTKIITEGYKSPRFSKFHGERILFHNIIGFDIPSELHTFSKK